MRVKRYVVDTMPEAMEKIRAELGNDAMILNTKQIKTGGILGFFKKSKLEVTAAIDKGKKGNPAGVPIAPKVPSPVFTTPIQPKVERTELGVKKPVEEEDLPFNTFEDILKDVAKTKQNQGNIYGAAPKSVTDIAKTEVSQPVEAFKPAEFKTEFEKEEQKSKAEFDRTDKEELLDEIKGMKHFIAELLTEREETLPEGVQEINSLYTTHNIDKGVRSELITSTIFKLKEKANPTQEDAYRVAKQVLEDYLRKFTFKTEDGRSFSKIIAFVGPTGVGKTTTIAKLAAHLILTYGKKVGLITADTYRIGAVEQLKTYANIIRIPIAVAENLEELKDKLKELETCDIILMDTAGRNYLQEDYIKELEKLFPKDEDMDVNLVLSLTTKPDDMNEIIQNFSEIDIDHVIFTKIDETKSYGSILNVLAQTKIPVTYITNGQDVPDDILIVTPELISGLLLPKKYSGTLGL